MSTEYPTVEVSQKELPDTDFTKMNPAIYEITIQGVKYEILIHYKPESKHAVVLGTPALVNRPECRLPVFSRRTWSREINATCIYYFDPTLYRSEEITLCWYYGSNDDWYLEKIARIIEVILNAIHVSMENTLFFGSSGGGFSSVELAVLLRGRATVINPQFFVENYYAAHVRAFKDVCLKNGESLIKERVDVTELMAKERYVPPIHLFVNTLSKIDTAQQVHPFLRKLQKMGYDLSGLRVTEYTDDAGHNGMPDKYDCIAAIHEDLYPLSRPVEADGEDTAEYMNWLTKPNGLPAEIGDISGCPGKLYGDADSMERKDPRIHRIYPKTGQYFYRSPSDGEPKDDTWKLVKSGHSVSARRHADDLEFLLYAKGYDIFADAGIYGYRRNIYRKYFLSAMAHNTVIVDNASYSADSGDDSRVGILSYTFGEDYDRVTLFNDSYEGVHITREFYTDRDLTILRDTAESDRYHEYAQLFHLGEHISVYRSDGSHVCLKIADTGYFVHIIQCGDPNRLQIIEGNTEIPIYGLISHAQNHIAPITTLKYDALRKTCTYVTVIAITDADGNVRLHQGSKHISEIQSGDYSAAEDEEKVFARNLSEIPIAHKTSIEDGTLHFELTVAPAYLSRLEFAYYLYRGATVVEKNWKYTKETKQDFQIKETGTYHVRFFIKDSGRSEARWGEEADYCQT